MREPCKVCGRVYCGIGDYITDPEKLAKLIEMLRQPYEESAETDSSYKVTDK